MGHHRASRRRPSSARGASLVTVEELVDVARAAPRRDRAPALDASTTSRVVPNGAHPSYAHGYTERDNDFYVAWDAISRDRDAFLSWMEDHVLAA